MVKIVVTARAGKLNKWPNVLEDYKKEKLFMKTYSVDRKLYDENLIREAIIKVCKNKKRYHGKTTKKYRYAQYVLNNLEDFVAKTKYIIEDTEDLYKEFKLTGELDYKTHPLAFKPDIKGTFSKRCDNGKVRDITIVSIFPDQIIHQLIILAGYKGFMTGMVNFSYGSIPKRGTHKGVKRIKRYIRLNRKNRKIKYAAQCDISKCFKHVPHKILKDLLRKKFRGHLYLFICNLIIDSYEDGTGEGLPIGWFTSPWFCNFLFTPIDHYIAECLSVGCPTRYIDDISFFGSNKRHMKHALESISCLFNELGMFFKSNWQIFRFDMAIPGKIKGRALDTLGYRYFRNKTILRKRNMLKIRHIALRINKARYISAKTAQGFLSRLGMLKYCNSRHFFEDNVKPYVSVSKLKSIVRSNQEVTFTLIWRVHSKL